MKCFNAHAVSESNTNRGGLISMTKLFVLAAGLALMVSACTVRLADLTVVSTKNTTVPAKSIGKRVTGEHCTFALWLVHFSEPNLKEAFDKALEQAGPDYDALIDVVLYDRIGFFSNCVKIQGIAVNTKTAKAPAADKK